MLFLSVYWLIYFSNLDIALVYCCYLFEIVSPWQDEDDYSTTIMHPSRNSYTAPTALLNDIAKSAEHVSILQYYWVLWCKRSQLISPPRCRNTIISKVLNFRVHLLLKGIVMQCNKIVKTLFCLEFSLGGPIRTTQAANNCWAGRWIQSKKKNDGDFTPQTWSFCRW